jgi:hypothetical protein
MVMDDLPDRLRQVAQKFREAEGLAFLDLLDEVSVEDLETAADEIERLRLRQAEIRMKPDPQRRARSTT